MSELTQAAIRRLDHSWAPGRMSEYLDGELESGPRRRIERHATDCPECRALLDSLRRMLGALHRLPSQSRGNGPLLVAAVRRRLDEVPPSVSEPFGGLGGSNGA
jgi:anti-sigma factor RsiW